VSITYPARSSAAAELVLPLTAYRDAYGNRMLTDRASAVTIDRSTPAVPVEGRATEDSRWRK